jgi:uncharacterized protein YjbJ (UPF0337 family)
MNKDQVKGRMREAQGKTKEVVGRMAGDKDLEIEGVVQNAVGKVQAGIGDLKDEVKKTLKNV